MSMGIMDITNLIIKDRFGRECFDLNGVRYPTKYFLLDSSGHVFRTPVARVEMDKAENLYGTDERFDHREGFGTMSLNQCREELRNLQPYDYTDVSGSVYCGLCRAVKIETYVDGEIIETIDKKTFDLETVEFKERFKPCECLTHIEKQIAENREECFGRNNIMQKYRFENADMSGTFMHRCEKYADIFGLDGYKQFSLLLFGGVGRGKTYAAACIANRLIDRRFRVMFTSVSKFERGMWAADVDKSRVYNELAEPDLLVIDDLASERDTDYMHEIQFNMIQTRFESGKPIIVTTNLTKEQLIKPTDLRMARVVSRLCENTYAMLCDGEDRRVKKFNANLEQFERALI